MLRSTLTLSVVLCFSLASARAQDTVDYYDAAAKKEVSVAGTILKESPAGIQIKPARGDAQEVPASLIRDVRYKVDNKFGLAYRNPFVVELKALGVGVRDADRKKGLAEALKGYQELYPKLKESNPNAARYLQFRAAMTLSHQATDDPAEREAAITALTDFKKEHPTGWQIVAALKELARLQDDKEDIAGASETYNELSQLSGVSAALKTESGLLRARLLLRGGKTDEAEKQLQALDQTLSQADAAKKSIAIYRAQCRFARGDLADLDNQVRSAMDGVTDEAALAAGHNLLGDYYLKKGQPEDAFWEFLRVDVQYNSDREETAKALYHLSRLFDQVKNDKVRAHQCLDEVSNKANFGGTVFYRKAVAEQR
jgi:hypothetical protein